MAAIIGHRALSQLRAAGRPGLFPNAQRNGLPRSRQVSASGHGNAQQHTGFMSSQHRASSPATWSGTRRSAGTQAVASLAVILLLALATPLLAEGAETFCSSGAANECTASLVDSVKEKNEANPVIVYSKSWCPYCARVKALFQKLEVDAKVIELDEVVEGDDVQRVIVAGKVQAALYDITGVRTVPQVFIDGKFVGGSDDTLALHSSGKLKTMLDDIGVAAKFD